jgi:hypothetical protein
MKPAIRGNAESDSAVIKEALKFAQELADREISQIQRMHDRSLRYIGFVLTAAFALFGVVGWLGYQNLRNTAVGVAQRQMKAEVAAQVAANLKKADVTDIVREQLTKDTRAQLDAEIKKEIKDGPLHQEIVTIAADQSRQIIGGIFRQRHFSAQQAEMLNVEMSKTYFFATYPIHIRRVSANSEAENYANEILNALVKCGATIAKEPYAADAPATEGVTIYYEPKVPTADVNRLVHAFSSAGVETRAVSSPIVRRDGVTTIHDPMIEIWVGPEPIRVDRVK